MHDVYSLQQEGFRLRKACRPRLRMVRRILSMQEARLMMPVRLMLPRLLLAMSLAMMPQLRRLLMLLLQRVRMCLPRLMMMMPVARQAAAAGGMAVPASWRACCLLLVCGHTMRTVWVWPSKCGPTPVGWVATLVIAATSRIPPHQARAFPLPSLLSRSNLPGHLNSGDEQDLA